MEVAIITALVTLAQQIYEAWKNGEKEKLEEAIARGTAAIQAAKTVKSETAASDAKAWEGVGAGATVPADSGHASAPNPLQETVLKFLESLKSSIVSASTKFDPRPVIVPKPEGGENQ